MDDSEIREHLRGVQWGADWSPSRQRELEETVSRLVEAEGFDRVRSAVSSMLRAIDGTLRDLKDLPASVENTNKRLSLCETKKRWEEIASLLKSEYAGRIEDEHRARDEALASGLRTLERLDRILDKWDAIMDGMADALPRLRESDEPKESGRGRR